MLNSTLVTGGTRLRIRKYPKSCYWGALARTLWVVTRRCMMRDLRLARAGFPSPVPGEAGSHRRADGRQTRPRRAASCADHGAPVPGPRRVCANRRCPAAPTRSLLRQVLDAAEGVVADYGDHLLLISVFKCPDKSVVLPSRFLVRPPGLRAVRERPPQQPQE